MASNVDLIRRLTDEVFIGGDFSSWDDLIADDFVDHDPMPGQATDKDGQRQMAEMVLATFSDRKFDGDDYMDTTDGRVVENWWFHGRHTGEAMGFPPSGQEVVVRGIEIWRIANGKIAERWGVIDITDVLQKAGALSG
jgi:steroid delta-isomerase-like uncharacterized protein